MSPGASERGDLLEWSTRKRVVVSREFLESLSSATLYMLLALKQVPGRSRIRRKKDRIDALGNSVTLEELKTIGVDTTGLTLGQDADDEQGMEIAADLDESLEDGLDERLEGGETGPDPAVAGGARGKMKRRAFLDSRDYQPKEAIEILFENVLMAVEPAMAIAAYSREERDPIIVLGRGGQRDAISPELGEIMNQTFDRLARKQLIVDGRASYFDTELNRLVFIPFGKMFLCMVLELDAAIDDVVPFAYMAAEKLSGITNGVPVDLAIPFFTSSRYPARQTGDNVDFSLFNALSSEIHAKAKLSVIGDENVGKTSLVYRFSEGKFKENFIATLGVSITRHTMRIGESIVDFNIWDMGGQDAFGRVRMHYYKGTNACIVVFDLTSRRSFNRIEKWMEELQRFSEKDDIPIILIGNKNDLFEEREISTEEAISRAGELGLSYIETSAKTGINVLEAFNMIAMQLLNRINAGLNTG